MDMIACGATQVAAGDTGIFANYGTGTTQDNFANHSKGKIGVDKGDSQKPTDISKTKSNAIAITRFDSDCVIDIGCVDENYKAKSIRYKESMAAGNGPEDWKFEICGKDGAIKTYTASCDTKRVIDAMGDAMSDLPKPTSG